ncbi:RICIN domain-containing protein [Lentzea sp. NBC_00516]|uniref:ricin-type beta-trefoil lectin domain protein n=1 Tax=Lentzea sp. NBC_00516 TaxID=2903582 RepID=UPI002E804A74|nr:ricin-type beta-trefoil lectin domain protein [Lentzea sp. NBC_00516]WUD26555.1 RICIN domain-containing protein [Lentzea sp. NBC_00516]
MRASIFAVLATLILGVFTAPAANAADLRQYVKTPSGRYCLYGSTITSGETGLVATRACAASSPMIWTWDGHVGKGHWAKFKSNDNCLDSNAQGAVYMHRCQANSPNQLWMVYKNDARGWLMIENYSTKKCLTHLSEGGGASAHGCSTGDSTQWWGVANRP